jgi:hypothetical protein
MISQGAWIVRIVGVVGLYWLTWAFLRPQTQAQTLIALATWFLPMVMWWINSERIYRWFRKKLGR